MDIQADPQTKSPPFAGLLELAKREIGTAVIGQDKAVEAIMIAVLARGHILIEGPPGSAKTMLARAVARAAGGFFQRLQMTPETGPSDILGDFARQKGEEVFQKGPIFTNVFLADEINRGPAKTQAALLEAMQERHVTVRGKTLWIDAPFTVVATQNPYEHQGVYPLAESQLDRFLVKIEVSYPDADEELKILELPHRGAMSDAIGDITPFLANGALLRAQEMSDSVVVPTEIARMIVAIVRHTRNARGVELGASSRAALHLLAAARSHAMLKGRSFVVPDDVLTVAYLVLPHRIIADYAYHVVHDAVAACIPDGAAPEAA